MFSEPETSANHAELINYQKKSHTNPATAILIAAAVIVALSAALLFYLNNSNPKTVRPPQPKKTPVLNNTRPKVLETVSIEGVPDISTAVPSEEAQQKATKHNNRGMHLYSKKDYVGAIAEFIKALTINPAHHVCRYNLGCTYALNHEKHKALKILQQFKKAMNTGCEECDKYLVKSRMDADYQSLWHTKEYRQILLMNYDSLKGKNLKEQ
jgi:tetratricopeptide (TPR) repeat protein